MTPTFSRTGGARLGSFSASWPFARLSATSDTIRLTCVGRECSFLRNDIQCLSRHRGVLFSTGLRIEHTVPAYPEIVVFWTPGFETLKRDLESVGYEVREAPLSDKWVMDVEAFAVAAMSFIPLVGVLFGIAAIVWGLSSHKKRGKAVAAVGAAGIASTVLRYSGLF
jgi:hypothetical protein